MTKLLKRLKLRENLNILAATYRPSSRDNKKFKFFSYSLLKLMEESERTLEMFWNNHFIRLNKCLDLRKFEQKFKDVSFISIQFSI